MTGFFSVFLTVSTGTTLTVVFLFVEGAGVFTTGCVGEVVF
jgi:hypothetical protein